MIDRHMPSRGQPFPRSAALAILLSLLFACDALDRASEPPRLVPAIRLIGAPVQMREDRSLERSAYANLDGVDRPTFAASRSFTLRPPCESVEGAPGTLECEIALLPVLPRTPWAILETSLPQEDEERKTADDEQTPQAGAETVATAEAMPEATDAQIHLDPERLLEPERAATKKFEKLRHLMPGLAGVPMAVRLRLPESVSRAFSTYTVPPLRSRTILTPTIVLPGGGRLRTWIGVEQPAWHVDSAPVVFSIERVVEEDGRQKRTVLYREMLDPARRPQDRGWQRVEVPLDALGEKNFRLRFTTLPSNKEDRRPSMPVWGDPTILRPEPERRRARRVVLISLDTLRARSMSAYGYDVDTTPEFRKLLAEGTVFRRAFTTFSNTLGSHMSMVTGLYPARHGVRGSAPLDEAIPTLAERLREAGYETAAFTEDALLNARAGFRRGFARYFENKDVKTGGGDAAGTFGSALEWAKEQGDEPFFLFAHTYEVHAPYVPPEYTAELFANAPEPVGAGVPKREYEREVRHLDRLLAEFVAKLGELGPPDEMLLVVTADHGEEFLEHGAVTHTQLYDEVMQVPLFLRWPGVVPAGVEIDDPVSLVDIVPTILALTDSPGVPGVDGHSLVPLLEGAEIDRKVVFGEVPPSIVTHKTKWFVARSGDAKCMVSDKPGGVRCYDLAADPGEIEPLSPEGRPDLEALQREATAYRDLALKADADRGKPSEAVAVDETDPERREKLKVLGYVE